MNTLLVPAVLGPLTLALKASLVLGAAALVAHALRRRGAALRHAVWALGLGAALALPLLEAFVPARPLRVLPAAVAVPTSAAPPAPLATEGPEASGAAPTATGPATPPAPSPVPPAFRVPHPATAGGWLALVWGLGVAAVLGRFALGAARLGYWGRRAALVTDPAWLGLAHSLAGRMGLRRGVTLLRGDGPAVPMTWGVLRPVIWIPEEADAWSEDRRAVVLAHELAHIRRRDALTQWVAHVALALHWFNPLAHVAARRLRAEREHACDDAVLALGTPGTAYADHLLAIVRALGERRGPALAFAMARRSQFEGRLLAILDARAPRQRPRRALTAAATAGAFALLVPLAALRPAERLAAAPAAQPSTAPGLAARPPVLATRPLAPADTTPAALRAFAARYGISTGLARRVIAAAQREGVAVGVAFTLVDEQSGFRQRLVSRGGAVGLTQILPATAARVAPGTSRAALFDPDTNLRLGFRYLRELLDRYDGDVDAARTAYHAGPAAVNAPRGRGDAPGDEPEQAALLVPLDAVSDGDRGQALRKVTRSGDADAADVITAARTIGSPGERANVYLALLSRGLDRPSRLRLLGDLPTLGSPGDAANVLMAYVGAGGLDAATADAFFRAAEAMGSDGDHRNVLARVLGAGLDAAVIDRLLLSATRIRSDGDRANVLLIATSAGLPDGLLRRYLDAARSIGSSGDKANVLLAVARRVKTGDARRRYLDVAATIRSDGDRANVLRAVGSPPAEAPRGSSTEIHGSSEDEGGRTSQFDIRASDVRLTASLDGVERIAPGGYLDLTETAGGTVRRVVIRPDGGGLTYAYSVDGAQRPLDATARAWIRQALARTGRVQNGQRNL